MSDTYLSVDIETTGKIPGLHSMISLGAVAYRGGEEISSFSVNLKEIYGRDEETMEWWKQFPAAWARTQINAVAPAKGIPSFIDWAWALEGPLTIAANPATFDAPFIWHYAYVFAKEEFEKTFGRFRALDIRTVIADVFDVDYSEAKRELLPAEWTEGLVNNHDALDDARLQGVGLMKLLQKRRQNQDTVLRYEDHLISCPKWRSLPVKAA